MGCSSECAAWMRAQFGASNISCKARAACVVGNVLFVTGGTLHRQTIDHVWSFSPRDLRWRQRPSLLAPRAHHGCVAYDGRLLVLGGSRPEPPGGGAETMAGSFSDLSRGGKVVKKM